MIVIMTPAEKETLIALIECGPLDDGDVPSKQGRDLLISQGLAIPVIASGRDGFTAATYAGRDQYKMMYGADSLWEAKQIRQSMVSRGV